MDGRERSPVGAEDERVATPTEILGMCVGRIANLRGFDAGESDWVLMRVSKGMGGSPQAVMLGECEAVCAADDIPHADVAAADLEHHLRTRDRLESRHYLGTQPEGAAHDGS